MRGLESRRKTSRRVQTTRYSLEFVWAGFALETMTEAFLLSLFLETVQSLYHHPSPQQGRKKGVRKDFALPSMLLISTHNPLKRHLQGEHGLAGINSHNAHVAALVGIQRRSGRAGADLDGRPSSGKEIRPPVENISRGLAP